MPIHRSLLLATSALLLLGGCAGSRHIDEPSASDRPPNDRARLEVEVRYADGAPLLEHVRVAVAGDPIHRLLRIEPGGRGDIELPPGPYRLEVEDRHRTGEPDPKGWVRGGPESRVEVDLAGGEVTRATLSVVRAGSITVDVEGTPFVPVPDVALIERRGGERIRRSPPELTGPLDPAGQGLCWERLPPGEYAIESPALEAVDPITLAAGEHAWVRARASVGTIEARVRVVASDGSGPHDIPCLVEISPLRAPAGRWMHDGGMRRRRPTSATASADRPSRTEHALGRYGVRASTTPAAESFRSGLSIASAFATVELDAAGATEPVALDLVVEAPEGIAIVRLEPEAPGPVWLHLAAEDGPQRALRIDGPTTVALDLARYDDRAVEVTTSLDRNRGEVLRREELTKGAAVWRVRRPR